MIPCTGPTLVKTIAASEPDDGEFNWIPSNDGVQVGTYGLRIAISLVADSSVVDRSTEPFTAPEGGATYWVDDLSNASDEYTPAAVGSNRNTGKLATAPKPNPVNVLRTYELTAGSTMNIDTGVYPLIYTLIASGKTNIDFGVDHGFEMLGPLDSARVAEFVTAIPGNLSQTLIYLDDANRVHIRNLTLTGGFHGIHEADNSSELVAERLLVRNNAGNGILVEGNSSFALFKDITTDNHPGNFDGIQIVGGAGGVIQNLVSTNSRYGVFTSGASVSISGATIYNNRLAGIHQEGSSATGTWDNLSVYGNGAGLEIAGNITISNSVVRENIGNGIDGTSASALLNLQNDEVYGNDVGVIIPQGQIVGSRIYSNAHSGIKASNSAVTITGSTIHSNEYGFFSEVNGSGIETVSNNLFYNNRIAAIRLTTLQPAAYKVVNNTIYEAVADGIYASNADSVHLRNNIVWVQSGYGIRIGNDSQNGFTSNFNLLYATGAGKVGFWQGDRATLTAWQFANFRDGDSLSLDPLFVDADGTDGITGSNVVQGLTTTFYIGNTLAALSGVPALTRIDRQVNDIFTSNPVTVVPDNNWSARWTGYLRVDVPGSYTIYINSLGPQRLSLNGSLVIDDFSSPSNAERSYTFAVSGSGFIPIVYEMADNGGQAQTRLEWVTPTTAGNRQAILPGNLAVTTSTADGKDDNFHEQSIYGSFKPGTGYSADAMSSPGIDRGRPGDPFNLEPEENGGYINLGAYGNTATASKSPAQVHSGYQSQWQRAFAAEDQIRYPMALGWFLRQCAYPILCHRSGWTVCRSRQQ